jgi:hypothetical protein
MCVHGTCLLYVKMNLVISTSKMTNCHDGLRSIWYWRREKKSCSCLSSSFFHKQLPIHVTFHLYTSTNHFRRCRPYDKVVFWFITLSIAFLMCVCVSIYVILSHTNLISRSCRPMGQVSSVSILLEARMK